MHRERITRRGAIPVWGYDDDIGHLFERVREYVDAGCQVAVVVAYEDFHYWWNGRLGLAACEALTILNVPLAP